MNKKKSKNDNKKGESKIEVLAMRVSTRFNYILFPLDLREFNKALISVNYKPINPLPPEPPVGGPGGRLFGTGPVAQKGDYIVDINTERQFFGITSHNPVSGLDEFVKIMNKLEEMEYIHSDKVLFYELQARYKATSPDYKFNKYKQIGKNLKVLKKASEIFNTPMALFSLRFVSDDEGPNNPNHFEIWIQPAVVKPELEFGISIVYRNQEFKNFKNFIMKYEKNLLNFLNVIITSNNKKKHRKK